MVSRRSVLGSVSTLLAGAGTGCVGQLGPSSERVRWRRRIGGRPYLAGGMLYAMDRLRLHALSPADGETQWTVGWDAEEFAADAERDGSLCLSTELAADGERVYVAGCDGVRALRRSDGDREWFVEASLRGGVAVGPDRVYANGDDLLAVDAASGAVDWRVPTGGERLTRPAVAGGTVVLTNRVDGIVTAFSTDGEQRWQHRTGVETRSPTIDGDTVYVATAPDPGRMGELLARNRVDGTVRWRVETPATVKRGTRPVVGDERVFLGGSVEILNY
ncbi:PQQ-binding-like beta-propeller repeat protein [Halobaculum limi]|uniref:outer membrane protein assembly factor BamB family protein n=1 Tax=Halobaculum limi TaxID=3031916 RepID=UPI002406A78D|nr:PQQ-binding-like beta-propeller repeat protein [Halobaculum sp. YSMS11]